MIRGERGYTLVEMVVVMLILGIVMAGLTTIFVGGSHAETDLNRRFVAQEQARLALTKIETDLHCAQAAEVETINSYPGLAISAPNCSASTIDWCIVPSTEMTGRYALWRTTSTSNKCAPTDTGRVKVADYLTTNATTTNFTASSGTNVFATMQTTSTSSLELVLVDFPVTIDPTATSDVYELKDLVVARNSARCASSCPTTSTYAVTP